ncbi:MAG: glycosyltransferase family 2 protein [Patescibacteria group bacterium]|nr:glycosyltransferase family 2 protein [Patescibacteria group bacterium]MDP4030918.1 glycosyltransferase family 2 protein [Candidatus Beckwithbacteria bacterium]MDZ4228882.1 glycosyltransferase family 2 protein [Patescibacteria group bacterium]
MDLSIIIVNYKTKDLTLKTLASVFAAQIPRGKVEVILVDNASEDGTPEMVRKKFPKVKIINAVRNLGFAGGNNLGLRRGKGRYLLLLNSDTLIATDTLVKMVEFMDQHQNVGLSTCRVELLNGRPDPASHRGFPTPWAALTYFSGLEQLWPKSRLFGQYHQGWKQLQAAHEIDSPVGAFFFLRREALKQAGLLDENFFMYGEDIDLAFRIKKTGWKVMYTPFTKIIHLKGASGINRPDKAIRLQTTRAFFEAMQLFYNKHYRRRYFFALRWLVFLGIKTLKLVKILKIKIS